METSTMMRLGYGEFSPPWSNGHDTATQHARALFLVAVAEVAPDCPKSLAELLPTWSNAARYIARCRNLRRPGDLIHVSWMELMWSHSHRGHHDVIAFRTAFNGWATRWAFSADWQKEAAVDALKLWHTCPPLRDELIWSIEKTSYQPVSDRDHGYMAVVDRKSGQLVAGPPAVRQALDETGNEASLAFVSPGWRANAVTWDDFERRVDEEWRQAKERYRTVVASRYVSQGWDQTEAKHGTTHFVWLARFQVLSESLSEIAKRDRVAQPTVKEGVSRAAKAIGLEPRASPRGRPHKRRAVGKLKETHTR